MTGGKRSGRIGRNIFDIDPPPLAFIAVAVSCAGDQHIFQTVAPKGFAQSKIDETRAGDLCTHNIGMRYQARHQHIGKVTRL